MSKQVGDWFLTGTLIEGSGWENTANSKNLLERVPAEAPAASACILTGEDNRRHGYASIALDAAIKTLKDDGSSDFATSVLRAASCAVLYCRKPFDGDILAEQPGRQIRVTAIAPHVRDLRRKLRGRTNDLFRPALLMCGNSIRRLQWP